MTDRLAIQDTLQQWIDKINAALDLGTVDGYFRVLSQSGLNITISTGNARKSSTQFTVAQTTLAIASAQTIVIGVDTVNEVLATYDTLQVPSTNFIPIYVVTTQTTDITQVEDFRTWAYDDTGSINAVLSANTASVTEAKTGTTTKLMNGVDVTAYVTQYGFAGSSLPSPSNIDSMTINQMLLVPTTNTNTPDSTVNYSGLNFSESVNAGWQLLGADSGQSVNIFARNNNAGTFNAWVKFWHTGNFNPNNYTPVGTITYHAATVAPQGHIKANGATLSRIAYADLWAYAQASGNLVAQASKDYGNFGDGDGSTTFTIPDLRGVGHRGWDDGRGIDAGRGIGTYQADENASHSHTASTAGAGGHYHTGTTNTNGNHTHGFNQTISESGGLGGGTGNWTLQNALGNNLAINYAGNHNHTFTTSSVSDHVHIVTVNSSGGSETRMKNVALLACIKY